MRTFLVNSEFIKRKVSESGQSLSKMVIFDSKDNLSPSTFRDMMKNGEMRFSFKTICKAANVINSSVARVIKADERDRHKELDVQKLAKIMKAKNVNKADLGNRSHTDKASVSKYLLGKKKASVEIAYCYACALGIDPEWILKDKIEKVEQTELFETTYIDSNKIAFNKKAIRIIDTLIEMLSDLRDDLK